MLSLPPSVKIYVAQEPVDMRRGFDGLSGLVCDVVKEDPQSGHLFVFSNKRRNLSKTLWWDRSGYFLLCKRLERGTFSFFGETANGASSYTISSSDLALILEGIDLRGAKRRLAHDDGFEV